MHYHHTGGDDIGHIVLLIGASILMWGGFVTMVKGPKKGLEHITWLLLSIFLWTPLRIIRWGANSLLSATGYKKKKSS